MKKLFITIIVLLLLSLLVGTSSAAGFQAVDQVGQQEIVAFKLNRDAVNMSLDEYLVKMDMSIEEFYSLPGFATPNIESKPDCKSQSMQSKSTQYTMLSSGPEEVQAWVVCDDDMKSWYEELVGHSVTWDDVFMWAWNILEGGDDPFWPEFEIEYTMGAGHYTSWISTNSGNIYQLFDEGRSNHPKPGDCDVGIYMTGQVTGDYLGLSEQGGDDFIIRVRDTGIMPLANLWQHEASHNFGAPDHNPGWFDFCIMSYTWAFYVRSWCGSCHSTIYSNRFHFG